MEFSIDDREVKANMEKFISEILPEKLEQALEQSCLILEGDAKSRCPVDSGQLRQSITHQVDGTRGEVGTNVEYAPYVEIGTGIYSTQGGGRQTPWVYKDVKGEWHKTSGSKPQPYMKPALEQNTSRVLDQFKGLI